MFVIYRACVRLSGKLAHAVYLIGYLIHSPEPPLLSIVGKVSSSRKQFWSWPGLDSPVILGRQHSRTDH